MKAFITLVAIIGLAFQTTSAQLIPPPSVQIQTALLAAPVQKRDKAAVYGYDADGKFVMLRKGTEMICLADDPYQAGFSVACYHEDLEPFMKRGRDLRMEGKSAKEISAIREKEADSGMLRMPVHPAALYVYTAEAQDYEPQTGTVKNGYMRYVIYIPYATSDTTGLPVKPDIPGMPWLMDAGSYKAHIMISPPR